MSGSLKVSVSQLETGVFAPGSANTEPAILAITGLTAGGSGSQSINTANLQISGAAGTGTKSHHHE